MPLGATVDDAWSAVVAVVPALAPGRASVRFALNGMYVDPDQPGDAFVLVVAVAPCREAAFAAARYQIDARAVKGQMNLDGDGHEIWTVADGGTGRPRP